MSPLLDRRGTLLTWGISLVLMGAIAFVLLGPKFIRISGLANSTLPKLNALLSGLAAVAIVLGWAAVMRRRIALHRSLMFLALGFTTLFLICYLIQHGSFPSVEYGGDMGWLYYPVLLSHIALAAVIVPLVLLTLFRALSERFDKHRRIARWALPLWLYVSLTGVLVYLMCAPYY